MSSKTRAGSITAHKKRRYDHQHKIRGRRTGYIQIWSKRRGNAGRRGYDIRHGQQTRQSQCKILGCLCGLLRGLGQGKQDHPKVNRYVKVQVCNPAVHRGMRRNGRVGKGPRKADVRLRLSWRGSREQGPAHHLQVDGGVVFTGGAPCVRTLQARLQ